MGMYHIQKSALRWDCGQQHIDHSLAGGSIECVVGVNQKERIIAILVQLLNFLSDAIGNNIEAVSNLIG